LPKIVVEDAPREFKEFQMLTGLLADFARTFMPYAEHFTYLAVFLALVLPGLGLPIPEDIILIIGGWVTWKVGANVHIMVVVSMAAVLGCDFMMYSVGRHWGRAILNWRLFRFIAPPSRIQRAEQFYTRHGRKTVFICRFTPGLRVLVFMLAGVTRMKPWMFLLMDGLAAAISIPTIVYLAHHFAPNIEKIIAIAKQVKMYTILVGIPLALVILLIWMRRRRKAVAENA
jgi:membrane protein DedA with SNARE-associated domain